MAANLQIPSIYRASALWTVMGLFGLAVGLLLLVFDETVFAFVEWMVEISHSGPNTISLKTATAVRDGIDTWAWAGFVVAAIEIGRAHV